MTKGLTADFNFPADFDLNAELDITLPDGTVFPPHLTTDRAKHQIRLIAKWVMVTPSHLFVTQDMWRYKTLCAQGTKDFVNLSVNVIFDNPMSLSRLAVTARRQKQAHGPTLVFVDPVDTIDLGVTFDSDEDRTEAVIQGLDALACEVGVTVIVSKTTGAPELLHG